MEKETVKTIYTYIGFAAGEEDETGYYIYDPETNKHHKVSKEKYDEVMKNADS